MIFLHRFIYVWSLVLILSTALSAMDADPAIHQLFEHVFQSAPQELKLFASDITQQPHAPSFPRKLLLLIGTGGSGKTTLAHALLYAAHKAKHDLITLYTASTDAQNLPKIDSTKKTVVVFDDIDRVCCSTLPAHITAFNQILTTLDAQKTNHNLFVLGTLQQIHGMPESFKGKTVSHMVWLTEPTLVEKINHLRSLFTTVHHCTLADECTTQFFERECIAKIDAHTVRDLETIVLKTLFVLSRQDPNQRSLSTAHIRQAIALLIQEKEKMKDPDNPYNLSEAELQQVRDTVIAAQTTQAYDIDQFTRELAHTLLNERQCRHVIDLLARKNLFKEQEKKNKKKQ